METEATPDSDEQQNEYVDDITETEDVDTVVKSMLTENTGRHMLDSGDHYGRHHEENQENPPWEKPRTLVERDYVTRNVYHHLTDTLERNGACTRLERALYGFGEVSNESWLTDMEEFAQQWGDETYLGGVERNDVPVQSFNTYNHEFGSLTQDIQVVGFSWDQYDYVIVQVHGGCDIRGGYTKPRVFRGNWRNVITHEFSFYCDECRWSQLESSLDYDILQDMTRPEENELECPECGSHDVRA